MRQTSDRLGLRATVLALALASSLSASIPARAEGKQPSASAKQTARQLLISCREKRGEGNLREALKDCQGAHAIMGVPSTGLDLARVHEAMGQIVEARELALEVTRFDNAAGNATFAEAMSEADKLARRLEPTIPSLVIHVSGPPEGAEITVRVDAETIPQAAIALPYKVNPGEHSVTVSAAGFAERRERVAIAAGQTRRVDVTLLPASGGEGDVADPWRTYDKPPEDAGDGRQIPAWAWVAGGVGIVGAGLAIGFGVDFADAQATVARDCPENACDASYTAEQAAALQGRWNRSLALTIAGGALGAAGLGAAIYGIASAPKKGAPAAGFVPWIGPGVLGAAALGRF